MNEKLTIKKIAKVTNGKSDVKDAKEDGEFVFFDRSTLIKRSDNYLFDSEAIIIAGEDSRQIFEPRHFKGKFNLHQRCYVIYDFNENYYPKYLFYKLKTLTKHFANVNVGSTVPSLRLDHITDLEINFPNYSTQKSIAKVLSDLDAKIELNNRINRELEAMAKTLYDYWFVQFDFPNEHSKPYKSSGGKMVYNTELKREIPEGWVVKTLLDIATYINGFACQNYRPTNEDYLPVIKIREMRDGITESTEKVKADIPDKLIVNDGDVLFSWSASLEVMIWSGGKGGLNQHIFKVTSKKYPRSFYYYQLIWYLQHFKMIAELRKTTMGHITQDHLKQSRIVIPPIEIVNELDKKLFPIQEKQILLHKQNQQLSELRDWLLPMLMNGQVTVGDSK